MKPSLLFETKLWKKGLLSLAGIDEVGRGSLAGPLVVSAVIFPRTVANLLKNRTANPHPLHQVNDSKLLSSKKRRFLAMFIRDIALDHAFGSASHVEIDRFGIVKATQKAMRRAVKALRR